VNRFAKFGYAVLAYAKDPAGLVRLLRRLPTQMRLLYRVFKDRRTGWGARVVMLLTMLYVISPWDLIPVLLLPGIGLLDDLAVLIYGSRWFLSLAPPEVVEDHARALSQAEPARGS